jgi:dihydrofolate synthase/folylpolyglutamate synthase
MKNAPDPLNELFARTHMGIRLDLSYMHDFLEALGNPQERFLSVHVAGTNGKGSTCAILDQGIREMGLKTGLFTSPHLVKVNERIRVDGEVIGDDVFADLLARVQKLETRLERLPTFFEVLTAVAFLAFAEAGVQVAVLETGLGGRLDCTNVVTPLVSVITRVDMDHQKFLGSTLEKIAAEKAGIIKAGRPVVLGAQALAAEAVVRQRAEDLECVLHLVPLQVSISGRKQSLKGQTFSLSTEEAEYGRVQVPLLGQFQLENISTAVVALEEVARQLTIPLVVKTLKSTLASVRWAARGEVLRVDPPLLLDVAHNPGGAQALAVLLNELFGRKAKGVFVLASMRDKDTEEVIRILKPWMQKVYTVQVSSERSRSAEELCALVRKAGIDAEAVTVDQARVLMRDQPEAAFGCITGSVYLAGAWLAEQDPEPGDPGYVSES